MLVAGETEEGTAVALAALQRETLSGFTRARTHLEGAGGRRVRRAQGQGGLRIRSFNVQGKYLVSKLTCLLPDKHSGRDGVLV